MLHDKLTPYQSEENKNIQVATMFNNIAGRYDLLNTILSFGIHYWWRKKCINFLKNKQPNYILDVATGTADFAIQATKLNAKKIIGIDISKGMLEIGKEKILKKNLSNKIFLHELNIETENEFEHKFNAVTVGFGVRNFSNLNTGLKNIYNALEDKGDLVILEFSYPTNFVMKALYAFHFNFILPVIGKLFSKDKIAYTYLNESVKLFPKNEQMCAEMNLAGFKNCKYKPMSFGIVCMYTAEK